MFKCIEVYFKLTARTFNKRVIFGLITIGVASHHD